MSRRKLLILACVLNGLLAAFTELMVAATFNWPFRIYDALLVYACWLATLLLNVSFTSIVTLQYEWREKKCSTSTGA